MKVMCIDDDFAPDGHEEGLPFPKLNDIDTVIASEIFDGELYYAFERFGVDIGYDADCFIPISEIDEREFERNYLHAEKFD